MKKTSKFSLILIMALIGWSSLYGENPGSSSANDSYIYAMQDKFREVARTTLPAVIEINVTEIVKQTIPGQAFPWNFFGDSWPFALPDQNNNNNGNNQAPQPQEREFRKEGLGSGVLVRQDGRKYYAVTNNHVVGEADEISVKLYDGRTFDATVVGTDSRTDLALITFESREALPLMTLADSEQLMVGDIVFAVGNPLGFESTVTQGIISALGRKAQEGSTIADFTDYIQTDAAINPGNSGGALVNLKGQLIGINTWIASGSGGSVGLGFAIPVNTVKRVVDDFISKGRVEYGWLGVTIGNPPAEGIDLNGETGAFTGNIFAGSPAEKGGLLPGDLITAVDGQKVDSSDQLQRLIGTLPPGREISLDIIRLGRKQNLRIRLDARKTEEEIGRDGGLWPGISVISLTDELRDQLDVAGRTKGVVVAYVAEGSSSAAAGIRQGDIVTRVNSTRIGDLTDFYKALNDEGDEINFRILREGKEILLGIVK
ncbi:MAG: Do family serine endopeptidase [Spirochaetales bacterium]|nr:Do family serine endopeptidase [Spirochaetales bacterium]